MVPFKLDGVDAIPGRASKIVTLYVGTTSQCTAGDAIVLNMADVGFGGQSGGAVVRSTQADPFSASACVGISLDTIPTVLGGRGLLSGRLAAGFIRVVVGGYVAITNSAAGTAGDILVAGISATPGVITTQAAAPVTGIMPVGVRAVAGGGLGAFIYDKGFF